jgi:hypothetical protein
LHRRQRADATARAGEFVSGQDLARRQLHNIGDNVMAGAIESLDARQVDSGLLSPIPGVKSLRRTTLDEPGSRQNLPSLQIR